MYRLIEDWNDEVSREHERKLLQELDYDPDKMKPLMVVLGWKSAVKSSHELKTF